MSTKIDDDTLYDVPGLAKMLGVTEKTIRKILVNRAIKGKKLGKKWYATGAIIKAYFEDEKQAGDKNYTIYQK